MKYKMDVNLNQFGMKNLTSKDNRNKKKKKKKKSTLYIL